jgi:UDP-N-acetylmuramoyl-tripeptide--D-alanyl-D-alanine ligase
MNASAQRSLQGADRKVLRVLAERLQRREIAGVSIDSRTVKAGELFVALRGDRFDGHDFVPDAVRKGAWGALIERPALGSINNAVGGTGRVIPVEDTLLALQEMSLLHRQRFSLPVIGVTGSNGKTTTKEMLACILQQRGPVLKNEGNLNNHIGVPLTLFKLSDRHQSAVIEMGMSGPGEIAVLTRLAIPLVGIITNVGPAHLEFLHTTDAVAQAKGELLQGMRTDGTAVLNADDRYFETLREMFPGRTVEFGITGNADVRATDIIPLRDATDMTLHAEGRSVTLRLRTVGRHNVSNALAAAAAATTLAVPLETVKIGLEGFQPVALRSELREVQGRTVLADCYNANPASMQAALETLVALGKRRTVAVLGDMLELGETTVEAHRNIGRAAARLHIDLLIGVGPLGRHIAEGARAAGMAEDQAVEAETPSRAAALLRERSRAGDAVLVKGSRGMKMETILEEF